MGYLVVDIFCYLEYRAIYVFRIRIEHEIMCLVMYSSNLAFAII